MSRRTPKKKNLQRLNTLFAQTEHWLGENNEKRVVAAYNQDYPYPHRISWIREVRKATREEDHAGIDVLFVTDVGILKANVKSSERAREEFVNEQARGERDPDIICVFISTTYDSAAIVRIMTPLLATERKIRLRQNQEALVVLEKVL